MNRRQLGFVILLNAILTVLISSCVFWFVERRRPDPEELAASRIPQTQAVAASTLRSTGGNNNDVSTTSNNGIISQPSESAADEPQAAPSNNSSGGDIYIIQPGDSLTGIASKFGVTTNQLLNINNLDNPDFVFVGQRLILPSGTVPRNALQPSAANNQPSPAITGSMEVTAVNSVGIIDAETVLVVNESDAAFNLQGWTLGREGGPFYTFGNLPVFPGGSVRVHTRTGNDTSIDLYWGQPASVWASGSTVRLTDVQGELVHTFTIQ